MGAIISSQLEKLLSDYTYNYQGKKISLGIFNGQLRVENLLLNDKAINKIIASKKLPIELKFGLLKKFEMKFSVIGMRLDSLTIENLIFIVGPTDYVSQKLDGPQEEAELLLLYQNYLAAMTGRQGNFRQADKDFYEREISDYFKMREAALEQQRQGEVKAQEPPPPLPKPVDPSKALSPTDFIDIDILNIFTYFLNCKVQFKNIIFIFMGNFSHISSGERLDSFIATFLIDNIEFKSDKLENFTDSAGNFKKFINVPSFERQSNISGRTEKAYWNFQIDNIVLRTSNGNPMFYVDPRLTQSLDNNGLNTLLNSFFEFINRDKRENCFTIFTLSKISSDIIMFYLPEAKFPINALFINFDSGESIISFERTRIGILLDIAGYFKNTNFASNLIFLKPRLRPITRRKQIYYAERFGANSPAEQQALTYVCKVIAKEYFAQQKYFNRYQSLMTEGVKAADAKMLVLQNYCTESSLYALLYGRKLPQQLQNLNENEILQKTKLQPVAQPVVVPQSNQQIPTGPVPGPAPPAVPITRLPAVKMLNMFHIHFRFATNFYLNLLRSRTYEREFSIILRDMIFDLMKPVGSLKFRVMVNILAFVINFERKFYRINNYTRDGIFGSNANTPQFSDNIIELQPTSVVLNAQVQDGIQNKAIFLIDSTIRTGSFIINIYPDVMKNLGAYILDVLTLADQRVQTKILKNLATTSSSRNLEVGAVIALRQGVFRNRLDKKLREEVKGKPMNLPQTRPSKQALIEKNSRASLQRINSMEAAVIENKPLLDAKMRKQVNDLNNILKTIAVKLDIKTHPFVLNLYDENFKQGLAIRYLDSEIILDLDMVFKQVALLKAFNLEISSREALPVLLIIAERLKQVGDDLKRLSKK